MIKKIGIVGSGTTVSIGNSHIAGFASEDRAKITAVLNRTLTRSQDFISKHNLDAVACKSYEEMLALVDGVVICTPNDTHVDYAVKALERGIAVLLEKPISTTLEKSKTLVEVAKKSTAFNMVGYTNRFGRQVLALKELVKDNMNQIFHINMTYGGERCANPLTAFEWRMRKENAGAGALLDYGSHAFDLIRYICGVEIESVFCKTETLIKTRKDSNGILQEVDNDDIAIVTAEGSRNEICTIACTRLGFNGCTMTILGDGGRLTARMKDDTIEFVEKLVNGGYTGKTEVLSTKVVDNVDKIDKALEKTAQHCETCKKDEVKTTAFDTFKAQATAFIDGMFGIVNPIVCTIQDGMQIERILATCVKSIETHKMEKVEVDL